jgi:heme oxygenase
MLAADLGALGLSVDAMEAVPQCPLTELRDDMEALGSLYVMEGSTLGGVKSYNRS